MKKTRIIALLSLILQTAHASTEEVGKLYFEENRESAAKHLSAESSYIFELNNSNLDISGPSVGVFYDFTDYVSAGVRFTKFFVAENDTTKATREVLDADGFDLVLRQPDYSASGWLRVKPLQGYLNWFSSNAIPFSLNVELGSGTIQYQSPQKSREWMVGWAAIPTMAISKKLNVFLGVRHEITSPLGDNSLTILSAQGGLSIYL